MMAAPMDRSAQSRSKRLSREWRVAHPESIAVSTRVLVNSGQTHVFRELDQVDRTTMGDITYLCGAMSIVIDGREVMGEKYADDIWWWWAYWLNALEDVAGGHSHEFGGPSTPVALKLRPMEERVRIELDGYICFAPMRKFVEKMALAAARFAEWAGDVALLERSRRLLGGMTGTTNNG